MDTTRSALHFSPSFFVRGDIDGFFGLALDNLIQLLVIAALCGGVLGFPAELLYGRVLPGAAISILAGNLFEQPDLLRNYACDGAETLLRGGERWYALAAPSERLVQLTATPTEDGSLDLAMGLFSGCGAGAECLAFVDDTFAGFPEVLAWPQAAAQMDTVWLAVDCYAAPADSTGGVYDLTVDCGTVPTKTTNFGSFRARYR